MNQNNNKTTAQNSKSEALYAQAVKVMAGGISRNTIYRKPYPDYAAFGKGCKIVDIDGVERLDFSNNMASLIHGHAKAEVIAAVTEQLQRGSAFTLATEAELRYAQLLCDRVPSFEKIRFTNSGSEAIIAMIKSARAYTGKPKIAKVEGSYHGCYDYAEVSQTASPDNWGDTDQPASVPVCVGTPPKALDDVVVLPFNDPEKALAILDRQASEIACILIDPLPHRVGLSPASQDFVEAMHAWTRKNEAILIFDEVITFRNGYGGAQENYRVKPDLTAIGKLIGGGFPVGAVAGCDDVMAMFDPSSKKLMVPHAGTFSANPITMTAGRIALELFDQQAVEKLNALGDHARAKITEAIAATGLPACVTGDGSLLRVHLRHSAPQNYREAYLDANENRALAAMLDYLYDRGILMINTCSAALSTAMTETEIDRLSATIGEGLEAIRDLLPGENK